MKPSRFKRITKAAHLSPEEVQRDEEVRRKVMAEFPAAEPAEPVADGLSDELRKAIQSSSKSVYQICKEAQISPIVVSRFLAGKRDIRMATADRLARILGMTLTIR
jgi:transcriptional regulator with XRE-family HTH domain